MQQDIRAGLADALVSKQSSNSKYQLFKYQYFIILFEYFHMYVSEHLSVFFLDINECYKNPCDTNAKCTNNPGSFICACNPGYTGSGLTCTGIHELLLS